MSRFPNRGANQRDQHGTRETALRPAVSSSRTAEQVMESFFKRGGVLIDDAGRRWRSLGDYCRTIPGPDGARASFTFGLLDEAGRLVEHSAMEAFLFLADVQGMASPGYHHNRSQTMKLLVSKHPVEQLGNALVDGVIGTARALASGDGETSGRAVCQLASFLMPGKTFVSVRRVGKVAPAGHYLEMAHVATATSSAAAEALPGGGRVATDIATHRGATGQAMVGGALLMYGAARTHDAGGNGRSQGRQGRDQR
jgi:hypothetical protein